MAGDTLRLAFAGFRHGHILGLYKLAHEMPGVEVVAACEDDPQAAGPLLNGIELTCPNLAELLARTPCDAVAIGDYYARRGEMVIDCLRAGKHVICDKPICTEMEELETIATLARERRLAIGCLLDLRGSGAFRAMRRLLREGAIGEVHTVNVTAQHPLLLSSRPAWYFQPGRQGGTINDIGIHAMDAIPWITGREIVAVVAARQWNARLPQHPRFADAAQFMLKLDNGGGVLADVSYLAPDAAGYAMPQYWRMTCHGDGGMIETQAASSSVLLARSGDKTVQTLPADPGDGAVALRSFMDEIAGRSSEEALTTAAVLAASSTALSVQRAAS